MEQVEKKNEVSHKQFHNKLYPFFMCRNPNYGSVFYSFIKTPYPNIFQNLINAFVFNVFKVFIHLRKHATVCQYVFVKM